MTMCSAKSMLKKVGRKRKKEKKISSTRIELTEKLLIARHFSETGALHFIEWSRGVNHCAIRPVSSENQWP